MLYITDGLSLVEDFKKQHRRVLSKTVSFGTFCQDFHFSLDSTFYQKFKFIIINMKTYCVSCKKDTENKNPKVFKTKNGRLILK